MKPGGIVALVLLVLAIGCGDSKQEDTAGDDEAQETTGDDEPSAKPVSPRDWAAQADGADSDNKLVADGEDSDNKLVADGEAEPVDAAVPEAPAVEGLDVPPLALPGIDPRDYAKSVAQNTAGYNLHAKGKLEEAKPKYIEALNIDPGNLLARYNLASILVRTGDKQKGIALLAQFKAIPDCNFCLGIIVHSRKDTEWNSVHDDPAYKEVADGVKVWKPSLKWAAKELITAFEKGRVGKNLRALLHPRRPISRTTVKKHQHKLLGQKALLDWLESARETNERTEPAPPPIVIDGFEKCDKLCCSFYSRVEIARQSSLETMCVKKAQGGALYLDSLDFFSDYPHKTSRKEWEELADDYRAMEAADRRAAEAARDDLE